MANNFLVKRYGELIGYRQKFADRIKLIDYLLTGVNEHGRLSLSLFGSMAYRTSIFTSDIDLCVCLGDGQEMDSEIDQLYDFLINVLAAKGKEYDIYIEQSLLDREKQHDAKLIRIEYALKVQGKTNQYNKFVVDFSFTNDPSDSYAAASFSKFPEFRFLVVLFKKALINAELFGRKACFVGIAVASIVIAFLIKVKNKPKSLLNDSVKLSHNKLEYPNLTTAELQSIQFAALFYQFLSFLIKWDPTVHAIDPLSGGFSVRAPEFDDDLLVVHGPGRDRTNMAACFKYAKWNKYKAFLSELQSAVKSDNVEKLNDLLG